MSGSNIDMHARKPIAIAVLLVVGTARAGHACSRIGPMPTPEALVKAARVVGLTRAAPNRFADLVEFQVVDTLKGTSPGPVIVLEGTLTEHDDFNDSPFPYAFVRRDGRHGNCFAKTFRARALYMLLLKSTAEVLPLSAGSSATRYIPYWEPLAPTNEQVRGPDDRWVIWIRRQLSPR